jgi:D-3-phosphoglycerate dehydrogenase
MLSLPKEKIKIALMEGIHSLAAETLQRQGYSNIVTFPKALSLDDKTALEQVKDASFLGIRSRSQLTKEVLASLPRLSAVGCFCIGTNQVDLRETCLSGIPVFNAPHSNTRSVAEMIIGFTIMLFRGVFPKSAAAHKGIWMKSAKGSSEVRGKVLGIVGYGHIGSQVSVLAESMGMQVFYYDTQSKLPLGNAKSCSTLEELLKISDTITFHVPETAATTNMIGTKELASTKPGAFLINTSRGSVVDIPALAAALDSNHIAGAAIDVFPYEPSSNKETFESPLIGKETVILTPHVGGSTKEAQENIAVEVSQKLIYYSDRGSTEGAVNFPSLSLPAHENSHRILHIHNNIPGMLQQINKVLADDNINVLGQYLMTNESVGYVVLDIAKDGSAKVLKPLKEIEGTIRARVLY